MQLDADIKPMNTITFKLYVKNYSFLQLSYNQLTSCNCKRTSRLAAERGTCTLERGKQTTWIILVLMANF